MFRRPWIPQWKQTNNPWCGPKTKVFRYPWFLLWKQANLKTKVPGSCDGSKQVTPDVVPKPECSSVPGSCDENKQGKNTKCITWPYRPANPTTILLDKLEESQTYFIRGPRILVSEPHNYIISLSTAPNQQLRQIGNPRNFRHPRGGHVKPGGHTALYIFILWKLMYVYLMSIDTFKTLPLKWFFDRPEPFQFITLLHDQVVTIYWSTGPGLSRLLFHLYILIK